MTAIRVKTKDGEVGVVAVEHWADPRIYTMDFQKENGDVWPMERENLNYLSVEDF